MSLPVYAMNQRNFPELYERVLVATMFRPFVDTLLDRLELKAGERLIDVACGTGIVARCAKERMRSARGIVGVDISAPMLQVARSLAPDIDWREGDARALPVPNDEPFTVAVCHQGFQFFPERHATAVELRRVLEPNGKVGIATWRSARENTVFYELQRVAEKYLGEIPDQRFALDRVETIKEVLSDAGFDNVRGGVVSHPVVIQEGSVFVRMNAMALLGMSPRAAQWSQEDKMAAVESIVSESQDAVSRYLRNGAVACEMSTTMVTATAGA